jgi:hypothetical protein
MALRLLLVAVVLIGVACAGDTAAVRESLLRELQPVTLQGCTLKRYGSTYDGGYLLCENLIQGVQSVYSYGIDREDNWGCHLSRDFAVTVHQYDCFTPERPPCEGGRYVFHDECVGDETTAIDGNLFDTMPNQIAKNGDATKRLIVKMDVEGAEWDSLLASPDDALARIDQLAMELHGIDEARFVEVVRKLKRTFHLANLHFNNWACSSTADPFPAPVYQVLWVNKRLATVDPTAPLPAPASEENAPDNPRAPDCQLLSRN